MSELLERGLVKLAVSVELVIVANCMPTEASTFATVCLSGLIGQIGAIQTWLGLSAEHSDQDRTGGHGVPVETVRPPAPRPGPLIPIPRPEFL